MNDFFKTGRFLLIPFSALLVAAAFHENDNLWTPIFLIWAAGCLLSAFEGIVDHIWWKKEQVKRDYRKSFINKAKETDASKYKYLKREYPLPKEFRSEVISKTNGLCFYCEKDLRLTNIWEMDHFYPHKLGGVDTVINLVPACLNCNERKWSKNPIDFILELWVCDERITRFIRGFLIQHRNKSFSYLTNDPYEKGLCDYWNATKQQDLFELIITQINLKNIPEKKKQDILEQAQDLVNDLFTKHTGFGDYRKKYDLKKRIEDYKFIKEVDEQYTQAKWEKFFKENPEPK